VSGEKDPDAKLALRKEAALIRREEMERIQDSVLLKHLQTLDWASAWAEIDIGDPSMPKKWVEELGKEGAELKYRVARAALKGSKDVPFGLKMSVDLASAALKARIQKAPPTRMNVQINAKAVQVVMPSKEMTNSFPAIDLKEEEDD
jgi:hypothetical protein